MTASKSGKVYATIDGSGQRWVLFQMWQGKGENLYGHANHSTPNTGSPPASVHLLGPSISTIRPIDYDVISQESANGYSVKCDLDEAMPLTYPPGVLERRDSA